MADEPPSGRAAPSAAGPALLEQLADLRGLRERLHPLRTKLARERAALRRNVGRL